jgi:hypothetical protein
MIIHPICVLPTKSLIAKLQHTISLAASYTRCLLIIHLCLLTACHQTPLTPEEVQRKMAFKALLNASESINVTLQSEQPIDTTDITQKIQQLDSIAYCMVECYFAHGKPVFWFFYFVDFWCGPECG